MKKVPVMLRLLESDVEKIDKLVERERERTGYEVTRSEVIRRIVHIGLRFKQFKETDDA